MSATAPVDAPKPRQPRWYAPTPAKFLLALLAMQGVLFLSSHYRWFWFNERKGYTVLIAVAVTTVALLLLAAAVLASRFFKSKSQFGLATLLVMVPVMAIPCGWLSNEVTLARKRQALMENPELEVFFEVDRSIGIDSDDPYDRPSAVEIWLLATFGQAFFEEAVYVSVTTLDAASLRELQQFPHIRSLDLDGAGVSDADLESIKRFSRLRTLGLERAKISDNGLKHLSALVELKVLSLDETGIGDDGIKHLESLKRLEVLSLYETRVSKVGVQWLQERLPHCKINRAVPIGRFCP